MTAGESTITTGRDMFDREYSDRAVALAASACRLRINREVHMLVDTRNMGMSPRSDELYALHRVTARERDRWKT